MSRFSSVVPTDFLINFMKNENNEKRNFSVNYEDFL